MQPLRGFKPVHFRHIHIEHNDIGDTLSLHFVAKVFTVVGLDTNRVSFKGINELSQRVSQEAVIVCDGDGIIVGAIGVTGDTSDNDEACALAAIEAVGLTAKN